MMKADIIALAPIMDMVQLLEEAIQLPVSDAIINVLIHEDDLSAVMLVETLPPHFTL